MLAIGREAGCSALLLTVDLPVSGSRYRDVRSGLSVRRASALRSAAFAVDPHPRWAWDVGLRGRPHSLGNLEPMLAPRPASRTISAGSPPISIRRSLGTTSPGSARNGRGRSSSRASSIPRTRAPRSSMAPTASSSPITAGGSSTVPCRPRGRCRESPRPSAANSGPGRRRRALGPRRRAHAGARRRFRAAGPRLGLCAGRRRRKRSRPHAEAGRGRDPRGDGADGVTRLPRSIATCWRNLNLGIRLSPGQSDRDNGRGERIRTSGPCLPKTVLYQAELLPDRNPRRMSVAGAKAGAT